MSKLSNTIRIAFSAALVAGFALPHTAIAQDKGKAPDKGKQEEKKAAKVEKAKVNGQRAQGENKDREGRRVKTATVTTVQPVARVATVQRVPPGQAKKHVTTLQGVSVTREVFLANGYQIVQVVPSGTSQVIYYRRGNMGRGRGLGPVEKIVVVPVGQVVQFQSVAPTLPQSLLATILSRLGM